MHVFNFKREKKTKEKPKIQYLIFERLTLISANVGK